MNKEKMKQSLLMGTLTSSFGIFVSKLLGLLYYSPLSQIAGESNMAFYSIVYTYYDLLLQISAAGIPFAIASLVAKYSAKEDYKTVLLVKKLGSSIVLLMSVLIGLIFILLVPSLAYQSLGDFAPLKDINNLKSLFYLLTIAVILVPFLSALRGYAQGLKRLDIYASSQVLEQFVRVFSILIFSFFVVKIFELDNILAIYVAVAAASIGAIAALIYVKHFSKNDNLRVIELANKQNYQNAESEILIVKEILYLGIPYVVISFLGTAGPLVNTTFFLDYISKVNGAQIYEYAKLSSGILQANCTKLSSIPSVLALGFGSGMVPYLAESLEQRDYKKITKQVNQILDTVNYILVPLILIFIFYAKDIYYIMYGKNNLDLGANLFMVSNFQTFLAVIAPILSSIMMSLRLRKEAVVTLVVSFLAKLIFFFPCVKFFGTYGMIYSSLIYYFLQILLYLFFLKKNFDLKIKSSFNRFLIISLASLIMIVPSFAIYKMFGFGFNSRLVDIGIMTFVGILMLITYYFVSVNFNLIQTIFNIEDVSLKKLIRKLFL